MIPEKFYVDGKPGIIAGLAYFKKTDELVARLTGLDRFGEPYTLYRNASAGRIGVPRELAREGSLTDYRTLGTKVKYGLNKNNMPKNDEQKRVLKESLGLLQQKRSHIIEGSTGFGKTYVALTLAAALSVKTLIVVNKSDRVKAWRDETLKFTDVKAGDIGVIQQDDCEVEGKKVCIGMLQSLYKENYSAGIYKEFGLVVFDEVHHMAADKFSIVAGLFNAWLRLGLSATVDRPDGRRFIFEAHIGPVLVQTKFIPVPPKVLVLQSDWRCPRKPQKIDGEYQMARIPHEHGEIGHILKMLARHAPRSEMIVGCAVEAWRKGRYVLVLSDLARELYLDALYAMAVDKGVPKDDMAYYVGGMKEDALEKAKTKHLVWATYQMAGEATDVPWWNTVILATPRANIKQAVGRILREYDDKPEPIVFDILDTDSPVLMDYFHAREKQYTSDELRGTVLRAHL